MRAGGSTNATDVPKQYSSVGGVASLGTLTTNAAINIATRGVERWGEVMRPYAAPTLTAS